MGKRSWVLCYGSRVEVLEPPDLRERVVKEHREAVKVYCGDEGVVCSQ